MRTAWSAALLAISLAVAADEFPGRRLYPAVPVIEMGELARDFDRYFVVDVRSPYEYRVIHMQGAVNVPLAEADFVDRMKQLRSATGQSGDYSISLEDKGARNYRFMKGGARACFDALRARYVK